MADVETNPEPFNLAASDAAALLGVKPATIREYADAGVLPCRRLPGGHRRFRRSDVERLLEPETST